MFYDLSVSLSNETVTYPSDPAVSFSKIFNIDENGYNVTSICMGSHSGTHVDLPFHCFKDGENTAIMPLDHFFGDAVVLDVPCEAGEPLNLNESDLCDVKKGGILIIRTGWENRSGQNSFFINFPYFSMDTAERLVALGVKAVGTDLPSVDKFGSKGEIHRIILSKNIIIIESLVNLSPLVGNRCFFSAVPLKIEQGDGSPVRAYAII